MQISIRHLTKNFGSTRVLKDVSLEVADSELFFLLGPSGCGKTTLLRLLAGFYTPDSGEVCFGERRMNDIPAHQRNTGMVFQNYALWPHLTVAQNVAYGLEVRGVARSDRDARVHEALSIVKMESLGDRTPNQLSGGQQQRVALARALVIRPDVLLLDEPLSNLDARLRLEMRDEIRRIHAATRITTVYVTHDQKEALSLADRMAVMREGIVEQLGDPRTVYRKPANRFVADFIGETNWMEGTVRGEVDGLVEVQCAAGTLRARSAASMSTGQPVWIGFRPEAVHFGESPTNAFHCQLHAISYLGEIEEYQLTAPGGVGIKAFEQNPAELRECGQQFCVFVKAPDLLLLPR